MKHSISNLNAMHESQCPQHISKRRKLRHVDSETRRTSPPHSDALKNTHQPVADEPDEKAASIVHWVMSCEADTMPPPTPQIGPLSSSRGRRSSKRSARASRTPSPSKRSSPQTYRRQNLSYAGVFIDDLIELPHDVERKVRYILEEDINCVTENESQQADYVKRYLAQSRYHARSCSLEGDWKGILFSLMGDLARDNFQCHTSEKREFAGYVRSIFSRC